MAGLRRKTLSGFLWIFAGTAGQNLLQFSVLLVLARILSPEEFGVISASMIIIGLIQIFSDMGVGPAIVQFKDLDDVHIGTGKTISALLGLLMGWVVYLIAEPYARFLDIEGVKESVQLLALVLPIAGFTVVSQAILQRNLQFKKLIKFIFLSHVIGQLLVAIPAAFMGYGYKALIYAILAQNIALLLMVNLGQHFVKYQFDFEAAKRLLNFGFGQSLGKFANYTAGQIDNLVVGKFLGGAALGFYSRAYQLMIMPVNLIGGTIDKVMFPAMAEIQDENEKLANIYINLTSLILMLFTPVAVVGVLCADEIVIFLLGDKWLSAAPVLEILVAVVFFRVGYKISDSLSRAKGSVYRRAWRQTVYAILVGIGAYLGQFYGLRGVSIGVVLAILCNYFMMLQLSYKLISFRWNELLGVLLKGFVVLLFSAVPVWGAKRYLIPEYNALTITLLCTTISLFSFSVGLIFMRRFYKKEFLFFRQVVAWKARKL
ncbi:lipopolysaccharide biosynthesis protein [Ectopseudomonas mendocina]|uniref:Lipopolysaccharide biosynthesis protein n=1 Tax=Ectopseudomonas mendocina TaxID=300 RepID=A0ABD7RV81_ECTME|nr:lipopolysaccharide biosynthesis protein [Pseudomonas mendocina]TRO10081.1 lipopolysaccharide biosynthesis protein [Pseudomonas mendocina]TRO12149.1 lipopolysaccharide biosynthesis protein [Pseudomonas mendocina]